MTGAVVAIERLPALDLELTVGLCTGDGSFRKREANYFGNVEMFVASGNVSRVSDSVSAAKQG